MGFKLNIYHRNTPEEVLLQDMRRVAALLGQTHLSGTEYKEHGKYSYGCIQKRFNGWINACKKAGLSYISVVASVWRQGNTPLADEEIIYDLQRVAKLLGTPTITSGDYAKHGKYDRSTICRKFKTWNYALSLAGLEKSSNVNTSNEELLIEIEHIWTKLGRQPTSTDIKNAISKYSLQTYSRRFGGWRGALETFIEYINTDDGIPTESKELEKLDPIQFSIPINDIDYNHHKTNRDPNLRLRFFVLKRDNFKCCACGASPAKDPSVDLHIDHIVAWTKGGETVLENLQTLCKDCNLGKSDL